MRCGRACSVEHVWVVVGHQVLDAFGGVGLLLVKDAVEAVDVVCEGVSRRGAIDCLSVERDDELFDADLIFASVARRHEGDWIGAVGDVLGDGRGRDVEFLGWQAFGCLDGWDAGLGIVEESFDGVVQDARRGCVIGVGAGAARPSGIGVHACRKFADG